MSAGFTTLFCILENEDGGFPNKPRQYWVNCQVSAVIKVLGMHLSWKVSGNLKIEVDPVNYEGLDLNKNDSLMLLQSCNFDQFALFSSSIF